MATAAVLNRLFSLENCTGIVTGGSSGLGLSIANLLAEAGARVFAFSRSGKVKDPNVILHPDVHHEAVDITDEIALQEAIESIGNDSGIDFLVNNAGVSQRKPLKDVSVREWDALQQVNLQASYMTSRFTYPYLGESQHPGRIVFISSMGAHLGFDEVVPYCASKAGLLGLMRGLAVEWAGDNILVNSVAPGWFVSGLNQNVVDESRKEKILARMPLHRYSSLEEVASVVLFLLSPAATYVTGQDVAVDGGALAYGF